MPGAPEETAASTHVMLVHDSDSVLLDRLQTAVEEYKHVEEKLSQLTGMVQGLDPQDETPLLSSPDPPSADRDPVVKAALVGVLEAQEGEGEVAGELVEAVPATDDASSSVSEVHVVGEVFAAGQTP